MRVQLGWALATVALTLNCASLEKRLEPTIRSLKIDGADQVPPGEIEKRILTAPNSWIPFTARQYFNPDVWRTDLRRIERFYREQGYYQARVLDNEVIPAEKNTVALKVQVAEGAPTKVSEVNLEGLELLPEKVRAQVRKDIPLKVGDIFVEDRWEGFKKQVLGTLREQGYAAATVDGDAEVDLDTQRAKLTVKVDAGERYRIGALRVVEKGDHVVPEWRILEKAQGAITPGDWYSESEQAEASSRVMKLGVFSGVKIKPGTPDPNTGTVPLTIEAQDSAFHLLRVGGGIAVDQTRNQIQAVGQYIDRDFLGGLRKLTLNGTAGYAWLPTIFTFNQPDGKNGPVADVSAELVQPRFFLRDVQQTTRVELLRDLEPAYSFWGAKGKLGLVWQPTSRLSVYPSYNAEYYHLSGDNVTAGLGGRGPQLLFGCQVDCVLSYLEEFIEWDARNDKQEPKSGYYLGLSIQEGGGLLGGSFQFLRFLPEVRGYVSVLKDKRLTFAGRIKLGTLLPANGDDSSSPIVSRFFSGGNDMRGFNGQRLAPQQLVPLPCFSTNTCATKASNGQILSGYTVPIGGDGLFEASLEARYNLSGPLVVATFFDTGFVTTRSLDFSRASYFSGNLLFGVGAGIRYRTPIGPVRLDLAYRPDWGPPLTVNPVSDPTHSAAPTPQPTYYTTTGCFGLGRSTTGTSPPATGAGQPEGPCVLHLSIGEAF